MKRGKFCGGIFTFRKINFMEYLFKQKKNFFKLILQKVSYLEQLEVVVPRHIVDRTKLICAYIEEETQLTFRLDDFLSALYIDFCMYYIKNPTKKDLLKEILNEKNELIKIVCDGVVSYENPINVTQVKQLNKKIIITIQKKEAEKGRIILDELYINYGVDLTLGQLIANLWVNFVSDYKAERYKKVYIKLFKILKVCKL